MALRGINVLDLTRFQNGPWATALLSDVGATVVKVEQPGLGDTGRSFISHHSGFNGYNESINRGKRSIELDLKHPASRPVMERLLKWADVLCENFKVGVLDNLGWGYEACHKINPRLIYCANSGFGPDGPWAKRGSFDTICQGASGSAVFLGGGPSHTPKFISWGASDQIGAMSFAFHIMAALLERSKSGVGQKVECSQLGAMVQFQAINNVPTWYIRQVDGGNGQRDDGEPEGRYNSNLSYYQCKDGKWLTCAPAMEERHWRAFCKTVGEEDLLTDKKTNTGARRWRYAQYYRERLESIFNRYDREKILELLVAADVPCGPVLNYAEVVEHPQVWENNYVQKVTTTFGELTTVGVPAKYSRTPAPPVGTSADLGEHTEEVLRGICGMNDEEIKSLATAHVTTPNSKSGYVPPAWMKIHKWKSEANRKARL